MRDSFSYWMRNNLKDAFSGLITQDIDFVLINKKNFIFIEEKNSPIARVGPAQLVLFRMFDDLFYKDVNGYHFSGIHILYILEEKSLNELFKEIKNSLQNRKYYHLDSSLLDILWDCRGKPTTVKTEKERSFYRGSIVKRIFSNANYSSEPSKGLYIEKIDWIFLNYCTGYFIFVEEKINNDNVISDTRQKFIKIIDDLFKGASKINETTQKAKNPKSSALYRYLGLNLYFQKQILIIPNLYI